MSDIVYFGSEYENFIYLVLIGIAIYMAMIKQTTLSVAIIGLVAYMSVSK